MPASFGNRSSSFTCHYRSAIVGVLELPATGASPASLADRQAVCGLWSAVCGVPSSLLAVTLAALAPPTPSRPPPVGSSQLAACSACSGARPSAVLPRSGVCGCLWVAARAAREVLFVFSYRIFFFLNLIKLFNSLSTCLNLLTTVGKCVSLLSSRLSSRF